MDVLDSFKDFLLRDGLKRIIHEFRNPEEFYITYFPSIDARQIGEEPSDPIKHFKPRLEESLNKVKNEIQERCENLKVISGGDKDFVIHAFQVSELDFNEIRSLVKITDEFSLYLPELESFITTIEFTFRKYKQEISNASGIKKQDDSGVKKGVNFGFKKSRFRVGLLKDVYYQLLLSNQSFIDRSRTPYEVFFTILLSNDAANEEGHIKFSCESKQAAAILQQLQLLFFTNLSWVEIEKSEKFLSRKETPFRATALSKYINDGLGAKDAAQIEKFFSELALKK